MENFVKQAILEHMTINDLICKQQHGFLSGKSCITNLLETMDSWTHSIDNKQPVDALYLDFQKAFDTVPHQRLIRKLEMYNIHPELVAWVRSFLSNREQRVLVNGDWRGGG